MNTLDPALLQRINELEKLGFSFAGNMFRGGVDIFYSPHSDPPLHPSGLGPELGRGSHRGPVVSGWVSGEEMSWDPSDDADDFWEEDTEEKFEEDGEGNPDPEDDFIGWYWEG